MPTKKEIHESRKNTIAHQEQVRMLLADVAEHLIIRGAAHDVSKLQDPELSGYAETVPKLKGLEYGTPEHRAVLSEMKPSIRHHYESNRHHPEHFKGGASDMNILDLIEMVCDWKAASIRQGGDFLKSVEISADRFKLDPMLRSIIANSADLFED